MTFSPACSDISCVWDVEQIFVKFFQMEIDADMQNIAHILWWWCMCSTGQGGKKNNCFMAQVAIATKIKIFHEVSASLKPFNKVELNGIVYAASWKFSLELVTVWKQFSSEPELLQAL